MSEMLFDKELARCPFGSYEEYMEYLFACVNEGINRYLKELKKVFATGQGAYKNVLYPDIEIAHDTCMEKIRQFEKRTAKEEETVAKIENCLIYWGILLRSRISSLEKNIKYRQKTR